MTEVMSVTRALKELKLLDKKITKNISKIDAFVAVRGKDTKSADGKWELKAFEAETKAQFQKVNDMIKRRQTLKEAVVQSNANTKVMVGGKEYTVAEAIEKKGSIKYRKALIETVRTQLASALNIIESANQKVDASLSTLAQQLAQRAGDLDPAKSKEYADSFREQNRIALYDPTNARQFVDKEWDEIKTFTAGVDVALSEINAITTITL